MTDQEPTNAKPSRICISTRLRNRLLTLFILFELLTAGVFFEDFQDFGNSENIELVDGLFSSVELMPTVRGFGIPFVLWKTYHRPPYDIRIHIRDESAQFVEVEVATIHLKYSDGSTQMKKHAWKHRLNSGVHYGNSSALGIVETPITKLTDSMSDVVGQHKSVEVTLTGEMIRADGSLAKFKSTANFEAQASFRIVTGWQKLWVVIHGLINV